MSLGSTAAKNGSLDNDFGDDRGAAAPATWYVAIFDGNPTTTGTELTGTGGVSRAAAANSSTNWGPAAADAISNNVVIAHSTSTGAWASEGDYMALMSASSGGDIWDFLPTAAPVVVPAAGYTPTWPAGDLTFTQA